MSSYLLSPTSYLVLLWIFLLGTAIGSFINVVVLRHETGRRVTGRSGCPLCGKQLTWKELIPIVSYVVQRGKCVGCGTRISPQYPLVEFATGVVFVLVFAHSAGFSPISWLLLVLNLAIWSVLMIITVYDLRTKLIPNVFSYTFSVLALLSLVAAFVFGVPSTFTPQPSTWSFLAGPLLFLPFYLLWKVSDGRWIGLGDGKLALGIGWFLGLEQGGSAILLSFWLGAGVSLTIIAVQYLRTRVLVWASEQSGTPPEEHGTRLGGLERHLVLVMRRIVGSGSSSTLSFKSEVPFGPFMVIATLYTYLFGFSILNMVL